MFGWLLGNSKAADKAVDGIYNGLDMAIYTDEEKAIANNKILDFKIEYAKATQGQSISRRVIAFGVTFMWVLVGLLSLAANGAGFTAFSEYAMRFLVDVVMQPFSIIVAFYFLAHVVGKK